MISATEKNPDVDISRGRLPGGRAFMSRMSLRGLIRIWQEESAGKTKQMLETCRRRKEGRNIWGMAREMGLAYSTVWDWLVRLHMRNLGRRLDRRSTGRKKMLTGAVLTYIERWLNGNPQRYEFEARSWQINMVLGITPFNLRNFWVFSGMKTMKTPED